MEFPRERGLLRQRSAPGLSLVQAFSPTPAVKSAVHGRGDDQRGDGGRRQWSVGPAAKEEYDAIYDSLRGAEVRAGQMTLVWFGVIRSALN